MNSRSSCSRFLVVLCALLMWAEGSTAQVTELRLKSFGVPELSGAASWAPLLIGANGAFYGTTFNGGKSGKGTVFRLNMDGSGYLVLHSFDTAGGDGQNPYAGLVQVADGALYGTTYNGGSNGVGTVFKLNTDGSGYWVLHHFLSAEDGANPYGGLVQGQDGMLYGTAPNGGAAFVGGTLFALNSDGSGFKVLRSLTNANEGTTPYGGLFQASDGVFYGTCNRGGTNGAGTVFKINPDGTGFSVLRHLNNTDGSGPYASLTQGRDGALYGTTLTGGSGNYGTVFRATTNGTSFSVVHAFSNGGGMNTRAPVMQGTDGALYGTTWQGGGTVFKVNTNGTGYALLHIFTGGATDGRTPYAGLIQGSNGKLYGTTSAGGQRDQGTVFTLATNGSAFSILYRFDSSGGDGAVLFAGPWLGADGLLYGTTAVGGTNGLGTVFKLATNGSSYQVLYHFGGTAGDGRNPDGGLMQGYDGALYGLTANGGLHGAGAIYKTRTNGTGCTILYSFATNGIDGQHPYGALLQSGDGLLYGTTSYGGGDGDGGTVFTIDTNGLGYASYPVTGNPYAGLVLDGDGWLYGMVDPGSGGALFKINTNGTGLTTLHNFGDYGDGARPIGRLLLGNDSILYGTTQQGGAAEVGTVFKMNRDGSGYTQLHSFGAFPGDGRYAYGALMQGGDGALYGQTYEGGAAGRGTVFSLNTDGSGYAVRYSFGGAPDGLRPWSGPLVQGSDGSLYGTTSAGGDMGLGILFRLLLPPQFGPVIRRGDRNFELSLRGLGTHPCTLQASTDLTTWVVLTNFSFADGTKQFWDLSATNYPRRFYRAVWPQ